MTDCGMHARLIGTREARATRAFFFIGGFGSASWAPLVPVLRERLAVGDDVLGLLLLCIGIGSLVSMPFSGALAERLGCRRVLTVSAVLYAGSLLAVCLVDSLWLAVSVILAFGALMGCVDVVINVAAVIVEQGIGRRIMSGMHGFWSLGGFVGAGLYGVWVGLAGLTSFQSTLIAAVLMLALTAVFGRHLVPYGGGGGGSLIAIPRGIVVFIGVATFIAFLSEGAVMDWSGVYLTVVRGMDLSLAGVGFSVFSAAMLLMRFLGDRVIQRIGQYPVAVGGALLTFFGILLVMFAPVEPLLYAGFFVIGVGGQTSCLYSSPSWDDKASCPSAWRFPPLAQWAILASSQAPPRSDLSPRQRVCRRRSECSPHSASCRHLSASTCSGRWSERDTANRQQKTGLLHEARKLRATAPCRHREGEEDAPR